MGTPGSAPPRRSIPALLSPVVVLIGVGAMMTFSVLVALLSQALAYHPASPAAQLLRPLFGLRPMLLVSELLLLAPALVAVAALQVPLAEGVGLRPVDRRTSLLSLAAGAALWAASLGLFEVQYVVWRPPPGYLETFRRLHDALRPSGPLDALVSVLAIAVAPAVCEEIVFRGIVLPSFVGLLGGVGASLGSALLFGLVHVDFTGGSVPSLYRVPFAFAIGAGLAAMRLRTGSLSPPILAHATLNTITFLAAPLTDDPSGGLPDARPLLGASLLLAGAAASGLVLRALRALRPR